VRKGFLSVEQYEKLLAELPGYIRPVLIVGFHVGNR
jgi:hypothetical protein